MELIYLYIGDDGKNIKDCEFNFSPQYRISYDRKNNAIDIRENDTYLPDFWEAGNISNITAVIGKNGAGKSNLLEFIFRYYTGFAGLEDISKGNFIHIYKLNGKLHISRNIKSNYELSRPHYIQYPLNNFKNDVDTKLLYYSTNYEKNILFDLGRGLTSMDISTGGLLRKYGNERNLRVNKPENTFSDIERLIIEDTFRQIDLFAFSNASYFKEMNLPYCLDITFNEGAYKLKIDHPLYNRLFIDNPLWEMDFTEHVVNRFLYVIFKEEDISFDDADHSELDADRFLSHRYTGNLYRELLNLHRKGKILFNKYPEQLGLRNDHVFTFGVKIEDIPFELYIGLYYFYFKQEVFSDFSSLTHQSIIQNDLKLSWRGTSAGELEYLNLISRIYTSLNEVIIDHGKKRKVQKTPDKFRNIILLLDEPENSFHPEWQRMLLDNLLHFFKTTLPYHTFQVIIASHSPILISDFPKENIIFLDKNEYDGTCKVVASISRENTFGANIHSLYRNSFFIDGLPLGEFAKKKINKLFNELNHAPLLRQTILREIQLIGEPILRDQLMKLYKQREGLPEEVDKRIAELENEIRVLKGRLND